MPDVIDNRREAQLRLYEVLDSGPPRDLQALVHLAAQICHVPRAALNLITATEQHQIATAGFAPSVCAREDSMCAVVLDEPDIVVVRDASADLRFRENPFVNGEIASVRFYASTPLTTPDGVVIGRLCVFDEAPRDLTAQQQRGVVALAERVVDLLELRRRSRELEASLASLTAVRDELKRSNDQLAHFAGQISHDLRTPLTAIMSSAELLCQEPAVQADPGLAPLAQTAHRASLRMAGMLDGILAHALVGSGLAVTETDLNLVLGDVLEDLTPQLRASRAHVVVGSLPTVRVDARHFYSVLLNLVSNAVKFTRPGATPEVRIESRHLDGVHRITVSDDGIGLDEHDQETAFRLFGRLNPSIDGSGIGLTTARRVVEAHGGRIGIDSTVGHGATAWVELPA
ncbi:MAG: GAF domain-containing sensor histidine kinase [Terracoccus sp.]